MSTAKLLPCPFCGSKRLRYLNISTPDVERGASVECRGCFTQGPIAPVEVRSEAKRLWNQRARMPDDRRGA